MLGMQSVEKSWLSDLIKFISWEAWGQNDLMRRRGTWPLFHFKDAWNGIWEVAEAAAKNEVKEDNGNSNSLPCWEPLDDEALLQKQDAWHTMSTCFERVESL